MKNKITPDEFFKLFGEMMAGLEGQYTAIIKSFAGKPFIELKTGMRLGTYPTAAEVETAAREIFRPLIEAATGALGYFDDCVMNCDPDEETNPEAEALRLAIASYKAKETK